MKTCRTVYLAFGLISMLALGMPLYPQKASALIPQPPWWGGAVCDSINYPISTPYSDSYDGLQACKPNGTYRLVRFFPGAWGEQEWQCTELVKRYIYLKYGTPPYDANGYQVVDNYPNGPGVYYLQKVQNNGTQRPSPGDVVSMAPNHTAIITSVTIDALGNGKVKIYEQNWNDGDNSAYREIAVTNSILQGNIINWLHDPNYISDSSNLVLRQGNAVNAKKGLQDPWTNIAPNNAASMKAGGDRFAYFNFTDNKLYARQGLSGPSLAETGPVDDYAITPSLLVVRQGTTIAAKAGLNDHWADMFYGANNMTVSGSRIAFVDGDSNLWVKDGINGEWYKQTYVTSYVITPKLIVVRQGGNLSAKANPNDGWTDIWTGGNATSLRAAGNRITFADPSGNIYAKQDINGTWFNENGPFDEYAVTSQLFVVRVGTGLYAKAGLNDLWSGSLTSGATNLKVGGSRITFVDGAGIIQAKDNINGLWVSETGPVNEYLVTSTVDD